MSVEIAYNNPDFPKDTEFDLGGVLVKNGGSTKLNEDQEQSFVARHGKAVKDYFENSALAKVTGSPKFSAADVKKMYPQPEPIVGVNPYVDDTPAAATEGGEES